MLPKKLKDNHLIMSGFYKGISGLSLFVSIPILIDYLGNTNYGVWVLVFALFQWVFSMDFGLASVLKSKVPVLIQENQIDLLKSYIKTTYVITSYIGLIIFLSFLLIVNVIDIESLLKITGFPVNFINYLFVLNIFFFCLNFILNVQKSLFVAFLKGKYTEQSIALNQILFFVSILILVFFYPNLSNQTKLFAISILNGVINFVVNIGYTIYFFYLEKLNLKSKVKIPSQFIKEILFLGSKFMVVQIGLLFIFTADNYILSNAFGPKDVVPYEVVNKLFQFPVMILFAALSPLWSMFAKDYVEKNSLKLLSTFKKFNFYFIGIFIFIIAIAILCPYILPIWIKSEIIIPKHLILLITIVTSIRIFVSFYSFFLYGISKLNNYIIILLISMLIKIPLTYYLISLGFGINSVVIVTLFIMVFWLLFIPYECYRIVKKI